LGNALAAPAIPGQMARTADLLLTKEDFSMRYLKYFHTAEKLRDVEAARG
jgi:hypothetical protein